MSTDSVIKPENQIFGLVMAKCIELWSMFVLFMLGQCCKTRLVLISRALSVARRTYHVIEFSDFVDLWVII